MLSDIIRGQALEIHWRDHAKRRSIPEYINMIDNKACLFKYCLSCLEAEGGITKLDHLVILLGRYFQIRNDYRNLPDEEV